VVVQRSIFFAATKCKWLVCIDSSSGSQPSAGCRSPRAGVDDKD
jgi:hypothetical protein